MFELGASAVGEIAYLAAMVRPIVSALLNARVAHLEGFGSIDGVIQGKGEIIDYTDPDGTVVLNSDEPAFDQWLQRAGDRKVISIGRNNADVCWTPESSQRVALQFDSGQIHVSLPTLGYILWKMRPQLQPWPSLPVRQLMKSSWDLKPQ